MRVELVGIGTIDMRKPIYGDSDEVDVPHLIVKEDDNLGQRFADVDWTSTILYSFVIQIALCSPFFQLYDEVVEWLEANNGLIVTYNKYADDGTGDPQETREGILRVIDAVEDKNYWNFSFGLLSKL